MIGRLAGWPVVLVVFICGCATLQSDANARRIDDAVGLYLAAAPSVKLGDSKQHVLATLAPTQDPLPTNARKQPDVFRQGNSMVEIHYFRSGRQPDGLTTDDEFTPYVFTDGVLSSIGWATLGGPKSHGQLIQPPPVMDQRVIVK